MTRLIDAEDLKRDLMATTLDRALSGQTLNISETLRVINEAPIIDAIPIEWIMNYAFNGKTRRPISITLMVSEWRREHETD